MKSYAALKQKPLPVMHTPRSVVLEITSRCNLRCSYCYFFDNPGVSYLDLPTEEWLQFIDELGDCGVMNVTISGGEVFIRPDLPQLISGIVKNRMRFSILSNGTLIDDDIASFLAKTGRCDYVQVSIDGSSAEVHDTCRDKGSFERAVRGIRILQNHDVPMTVRMTLHRFNVNDLENTAHFVLEELNLPDFSTNAAGFSGLCQKNSEDLLLSVEERQTTMAELTEVWQKNQDLTSLRQRHAIQLSDFDYCSNCDYVNYCTGNCPELGYAVTGQVDCPCPDACLRKFLEKGLFRID
jgi:SynChlorMet cassette radical SAM/SPASM protein ScmE